MAAATEEFPHGGEHLMNDDRQARWTIVLLAMFTSLLAVLTLFALR